MVSAIIKALASGLSLWESKESRKYIDKLMKIKKDYYEEYNKDRPDMAKLTNMRFELQLLCEAFSSKVGTQGSVDK